MHKIANYLYLFPNSNNYYLRFRFPSEISRFIGKTYFCKSLGLSSLDESLFMARYIKSQIFKDLKYYQMKEFEQFLRKRFIQYKEIAKHLISKGDFDNYHSVFKPLTNVDIADFLTYVKRGVNGPNISDFRDNHIAHKNEFDEYLTRQNDVFEDAENHKPNQNELIGNFSSVELKFKSQLALYFQEQKKKHLNFEDISINTDFRPDRELSRGFNQSLATYHNNLDEMDMYKFTRLQNEASIELLSELGELKEKDEKDALPLNKIYKDFIDVKAKNVKDKTTVIYDGTYRFLIGLLGEDYDLRNLNKSEAIRIQKEIINKPVGTKKNTTETLANKTVNRYISNYSSLMSYLIDSELIDRKNPFDNLRLDETKKSGKTNRRKYTNEEVFRILSYEIKHKLEAKEIRNSAFWFPRISLYSGMRLSEIADLTVNDFEKNDGIHCISLHDKDLKNENSERTLPIHSKLIEFGLLDLVVNTKKRKSKYLFDDLRDRPLTKTLKRDGWGITVSKWFNGSGLRKMKIDKKDGNQVVDFHAIRSTVLKVFKRNGLSGYLVKQIAGHIDSEDGVTFDDYGHGTNTKLTRLKEIIETINYDE